MTDISSNFVWDNINATCTKYVIRFIMSVSLWRSQPISVSLSHARARALSLSLSRDGPAWRRLWKTWVQFMFSDLTDRLIKYLETRKPMVLYVGWRVSPLLSGLKNTSLTSFAARLCIPPCALSSPTLGRLCYSARRCRKADHVVETYISLMGLSLIRMIRSVGKQNGWEGQVHIPDGSISHSDG